MHSAPETAFNWVTTSSWKSYLLQNNVEPFRGLTIIFVFQRGGLAGVLAFYPRMIRRGFEWCLRRVEEEIFENQTKQKDDGELSDNEALRECGLQGEYIVIRHIVVVKGEKSL